MYGSSAVVGSSICVFSSSTQNSSEKPKIDLYRLVDRRFRGKAPIVAVDSVRCLQWIGDDNPVTQTYTYSAGLISHENHLPRFGKTTVSMPHYLTDKDTVTYVELHYFNDIDSTGFYDSHIYDGTWFPDLKESSRYGIANGGFRLDGHLYLSDSYTRIMTGSQITDHYDRDSAQFCYWLSQVPEGVTDVYRTQLREVVTQSDGVTATERFLYHPSSGLLSSIWIQDAQGLWLVDSSEYAADNNTDMMNDHAWTQLAHKRTYNWTGTSGYTLLDSRNTTYVKKGWWQASLGSSALLGSSTDVNNYQAVGFDAYGNATWTKDARNVSSGVVYDADALRPIANITNGEPQDCLVQNFELSNTSGGWVLPSTVYWDCTSTDAFTGRKSYRMVDDPNSTIENIGPSRDVLADSVSDTLYQFSVWVKSNHSVTIRCLCYSDAGGTLCPGGNKTLTFSNLNSLQWQKVEGSFNISAQKASLHHLQIRICLDKTSPYDASKHALFDDFRFCPARSSVSTLVYDPVTGLVTSESDPNNVPIRYSYDRLLQYSGSRDYLGQHVDSTVHCRAADSLSHYSIWHSEMKYVTGIHADTLIVDGSMTYQYFIRRVKKGVGGIYRNVVDDFDPTYAVVHLFNVPGAPQSEFLTGAITAQPGDKIIFQYSYNATDAWPFVEVDIVGRPTNYPLRVHTPNYTWQSKHLSSTDSTETVYFTDGNGNMLETRSYAAIEGSDTTTVVSGAVYDARDRVFRQYKAYFTNSPGASVFAFDDTAAVRAKATAYYATHGPDCGEYPFTEYVYDSDQMGRVREIKYPGSFRQHPSQLAHSSSQVAIADLSSPFYGADSLFKLKTVDENGHVLVTYKDKIGRLMINVADSSDQGIQAKTLHFPDFLGRDTLVVQPEGFRLRFTYNSLGWLTRDSSAEHRETESRYDQNGNLRFRRTRYDIDSARFQYYKYDAFNRRVEEGIDYNLLAFDDLSKACDADFPRSSGLEAQSRKVTAAYEYDQGSFGKGHLTKSIRYHYPGTYPGTASWETYVYDAFGHVVTKSQFVYSVDVSTPRVMTATYNIAGQIQSLGYPNGKLVTYAYDKRGRIASVQSSDGYMKVAFTYWPDGRTRTKALGASAIIQTVDYAYNARGWLSSINEGTLLDSDKYALALTYEQGAYQVSSADPVGYFNGNVASYLLKTGSSTYPDVQHTTFRYDGLDRLTGEGYPGVSWPFVKTYTYFKDGRLDRVYESDAPNGSYHYCYYATTNRPALLDGYTGVISYTGSGSATSYASLGLTMSYNLHEQLSHMERPSGTRTYDMNKLDFLYNAEGKRVAKTYTYWYSYTCSNDPIPIDPFDPIGGGDLNSMMYNGSAGDTTSYSDSVGTLDSGGVSIGMGGMQLNSVSPSTTCYATAVARTGYYYFGDDLLADYRGPNSSDLIGNYVYANGERVAQIKNLQSDVRYYLLDHLGSVVATVNSGNGLQNSYEYYPWGAQLSSFVSDQEKFNYTGQVRDDELGTGFLYFGARYYDPRLRTFLATEPLYSRYPDWGSYVYALDRPLHVKDKNGFVPVQGQFTSSVEAGDQVLSAYCSGIDLFALSGQPRYVGMSDGRYVDLRHFNASFTREVAGCAGSGSELSTTVAVLGLGLGVEIQQEVKYLVGGDNSRSAFSPEDLYSNSLGVDFALNYFDPSKSVGKQVTSYLNGHGAVSVEMFQGLFPELWNALPASEDATPEMVDAARGAMDARWPDRNAAAATIVDFLLDVACSLIF